MAVVFSYPKIDSGDLQPADRLMISQMNVNGNPTKSVTLGALTSYIGAIPTGGTITGVTPDPPLIGGGTSGDVNIGIDPTFLQLFLQNTAILSTRNPPGQPNTPSLNLGITAADVRNLIGAGTGDGDIFQVFAGDGIKVVDPFGPNPVISTEYDGVINFINKCPNNAATVKEEDKLVFNSFDATPSNRKVTQISALDLGLASVVVTLDANDLNNIDTTPIELIPALTSGQLIKVLHASFSFTKNSGPGFAFVDDLTGSMNGVPFFTLPKAILNRVVVGSSVYSMSIAEAEYNLSAGSRALFLETTGATGGTGVGELKIKITYQELSFV